MKIRTGFVSNSSSSSFVIIKAAHTEEQIAALYALCDSPVGPYGDGWSLYDEGDIIKGITCMDNNLDCEGGLHHWMKENGFIAHWEYD